MSQPRFLLTNSLWLLIGRGGSQAMALLMTILVARRLGDAGLGQLTVILTIVFIGNVFSTFGLDTLLIRAVARQPKNAPLSAVFAIQITLSLLFIVGTWLFAPNNQVGNGSIIYSFSLLPLAVTTLFNAVLRGEERMNSYTLLQLFSAGCRLATVTLLLSLNAGFLPIVWGLLLCQTAEAITTGIVTTNICSTPLAGSPYTFDTLQTTFKGGFILALLTLFAILYQRVPILMLAHFGDAGLTGQFSAALRLIDIPRMLPYAVAGALFPRMAQQSKEALSGRWFLLMGLGMAAFALAIRPIAPWLVQSVFGDGYRSAATIFPLLAWSLLPFVAVLYGSMVLVARNQEKQVVLAHGLALLFAGLLGRFSLVRWGETGLATALITAESLHALILLSLARRK